MNTEPETTSRASINLTATPWTLTRHEDGHHLIVGPDHEEVAEILGSEEDALVLTAAPELLEAVQELLPLVIELHAKTAGVGVRCEIGEKIITARAALAKAVQA